MIRHFQGSLSLDVSRLAAALHGLDSRVRAPVETLRLAQASLSTYGLTFSLRNYVHARYARLSTRSLRSLE